MKDTRKLLFEIIRAVVCGDTPPDVGGISQGELLALLNLAKAQDMAHIVGFFFEKRTLPDECSEIKRAFSKQYLASIYRYQYLTYEYKRICATLEKNKIKYIPLKGSVIRSYYPEAWMRTSCDIDVLVEEGELSLAREALVRELEYTGGETLEYHDVSLYSKSGVHLELHFNIRENTDPMDKILDTVWHSAYLHDGEYGYRQSNEFLLFHQIAHAAYHFTRGGCGIRPLLDIWLLRKRLSFDANTYEELLLGAGLGEFGKALFELCEVWYSKKEYTPLAEEMENFILGAGIYGSAENRVAVSRSDKTGKLAYILSRIFMPYKSMKARYRILERWPVLLPACHVHRWLSLLSPETRKKVRREIEYSASLDKQKGERVGKMLREIGLQEEGEE
ncbi:MAG: nucleotidyltransferase family protein [Clostridia bacterium]|nr:nucleotidyltransferase family protein [Clostridia bacterium]